MLFILSVKAMENRPRRTQSVSYEGNALKYAGPRCTHDKRRHAVDLTRVTDKGDAFQHADGADDERKVGRDAEGVVEGDLRQVRRQLLEVDVFCAAALQCLVKHLRNRWTIVGEQSGVKCLRINQSAASSLGVDVFGAAALQRLVKHLWKRFGKIQGVKCQGVFRIDQSAASSCELMILALPPSNTWYLTCRVFVEANVEARSGLWVEWRLRCCDQEGAQQPRHAFMIKAGRLCRALLMHPFTRVGLSIMSGFEPLLQISRRRSAADLCQDREDGAQVCAGRDEIQRHKVLHDRLVIPAAESASSAIC